MKTIITTVRPEKARYVKDAIRTAGIDGMTMTRVIGHGEQGFTYRLRGMAAGEVGKTDFEFIVDDGDVDKVVDSVCRAAAAGDGDDEVLVLPVERTCVI